MGLKDTVGSLLGLLGKVATTPTKRTTGTTSTSKTSTGDTTSTSTTSTGDTTLGDVTIEYSPMLDGDPDPGEVVWTWVSYEDDPSQGKDRPVVVVGRRGQRLAGVALTSKDDDRSDTVEVGTGPWDHEGRPSFAKIDRILDIDPNARRREGAVLDRARFDELVDALQRYHRTTIRR